MKLLNGWDFDDLNDAFKKPEEPDLEIKSYYSWNVANTNLTMITLNGLFKEVYLR